MGFSSLVMSACLLVAVASQGIQYNSVFCTNFGIGASLKADMINKYKTMITNLNKDTTLKAQKTRANTFLNNNWKNLESIFDKDVLANNINFATQKIESRWRITTFLKAILAKIKPKLAAAKFTEIKNLLWATDKKELNNFFYFYDNWKTAALAAIPNAAKKTEISKILSNQETAYTQMEDDKWSWMPGMGFNNCYLK